jgi:two-component system alkaline phosphatase synthesis response regulator PhoP
VKKVLYILSPLNRSVVKGPDEILKYNAKQEFELFKYLVINKGIVLSRDKIMNQVWGFDYEGESRTVDMHIKTLRQKLGEAGSHIKTVRNVGYMVE